MKVTDFGLSRLVGAQSLMSTVCGTPVYAAPEVFTGHDVGYTEKVDVWSMGCVLFNMLSGVLTSLLLCWFVLHIYLLYSYLLRHYHVLFCVISHIS